MTRSVPTLAVSLTVLGLVAWMAISHPGAGSLFTSDHAPADARLAPASATTASLATRSEPRG